jgi:hypothetical protein
VLSNSLISAAANLGEMRKKKVQSKTKADRSNPEKQEKEQGSIRGPSEYICTSVSISLD